MVDKVTDELFVGDDDGGRHRIEPSANQRAAAGSLYGLYVALTNVGFNEGQALSIVGNMAAAAMRVNDET